MKFSLGTRKLGLIAKAYELAKDVKPVANSRIVSFIIYRNKIISIGYNQNKTCPFQKRYGKHDKAIYIHAEIHSIKQALNIRDDLSSCEMIVARAKKTPDKIWQPGMARPCTGCMRAIEEHQIKRVFFTTNTQNIGVI